MTTEALTELLPIKLVTKAVELQWRVVMLPWTTFLYWLSCVASLLLRFLVLTGSPPSDIATKAKARDPTGVSAIFETVYYDHLSMIDSVSCS
jgi:hypothetical protein